MLLTVDIGNTNITFGLFKECKFIKDFRIPSDRAFDLMAYKNLIETLFRGFDVDSIVMASVVDELSDKIYNSLKNAFNIIPIVVSDKIDCGVKIVADNTSEVGADRIANAAAIAKMNIGAAIAIDFGTATTFDIVNSKKNFAAELLCQGLKRN